MKIPALRRVQVAYGSEGELVGGGSLLVQAPVGMDEAPPSPNEPMDVEMSSPAGTRAPPDEIAKSLSDDIRTSV